MRVGTFCRHDVETVDSHATVAQAAGIMRDRHVGNLIVVKGRENRLVPVGIITDRDIVVQVVSQGLRPEQTEVGDVMSSHLVMVNTEDQLTDALRAMSDKGVRRAPVVDDRGVLRAVVSMDDLVGAIAAELVRVTRLIRREQQHEMEKTENVLRKEFAT